MLTHQVQIDKKEEKKHTKFNRLCVRRGIEKKFKFHMDKDKVKLGFYKE